MVWYVILVTFFSCAPHELFILSWRNIFLDGVEIDFIVSEITFGDEDYMIGF